MSLAYSCSECSTKACLKGGEYPENCPSVIEKEHIDSAIECVSNSEENKKIMEASITAPHKDNGLRNNRVETLIKFCNTMGYKNVGVAFCVALAKEAKILCDMLSAENLEIYPVCCKIGGKSISDMGVDGCNARGISCNPVAQANVLNASNTDINIVLGLCFGHDILFSKHSKSPITTLVIKDYVLKHNTVLALQDTE